MSRQQPLFHPLPPHIEQIFRPLCTAVSPSAIPEIQNHIKTYLVNIRAALAHNEFLDIHTAVSLTNTLTELLNQCDHFPPAQQALIGGAVNYFLKNDDAEHDTHSLLGLDDDVLVLNYVLDQIGLPGQKIQL